MSNNKEAKAAHYKAHKEEIKVRCKAYYKAHEDEIRARKKAYYQANREKIREMKRASWAKYRERDSEKLRARRKKHHLGQYGITLDQWDKQLLLQDNRCAACGDILGAGASSHTDHSHASGHFRSILCRSCNCAEGHLKTVERARKLYLWMEKEALFYASKNGTGT
jgi:hypothetical protein